MFLALLEMYKQGAVDLTQIAEFADLTVTRLDNDETSGDQPMAAVDEYQG